MRRGSTFLLKLVIFFIGIVVLALSIFIIPMMAREVTEFIEMPYLKIPMSMSLYASVAAVYFALFQAMKLLHYIEKGTAFSELSVTALKNIKISAWVVSMLFFANMPIVFFAADKDDAPGLILFGLAFAAIPFVIATFIAVLQRLLKEAIHIKQENEFTV